MTALARLPLARLTRSASARVTLGAWSVFAFAVASLARARGAARGADHVLVETVGAIVLPLLAYGLVGAALGRRSLGASGSSLVAFGALPARAAATTIAVVAAACGLAGAVIAAGAAVIAHGPADPAPVQDALTSAYVGLLAGAAYACWFALGAAFGRRGGGRAVLLFVDWAFGDGAFVTPRGHVENLFGGASPVDLSGRASSVALVVLACAWALLAVRRCRG